MSIIAAIKTTTTHIQLVGLLGSLALPFPTSLFQMLSISNLINFDPTALLRMIPNFPNVDQRVLFIVVAIGLPLCLMVLTAFVFFTLGAIMSIASGGLGFIMLLAAFISLIAPSVLPVEVAAAAGHREFWIMGIVVFVIPVFTKLGIHRINDALFVFAELVPVACVLGGLICLGVSNIARAVIMGIMGLYLAGRVYLCYNRNRARMIILMLFTLGVIGVVIWRYNSWDVPMPPQFYVPGCIILAVGCIGCVASVAPTAYDPSTGKPSFMQSAWRNIKQVIDSGLLSLALFFVQQAFIPVVTQCLTMFLCSTYSCPVGTKLNPFRTRPNNNYTMDSNFFCDPCNFNSTDCWSRKNELCPPFSSFRLLKYPTIPCDDSGFVFFVIAAGIVLIVFAVIIFTMFYFLIQTCTLGVVQVQQKPPMMMMMTGVMPQEMMQLQPIPAPLQYQFVASAPIQLSPSVNYPASPTSLREKDDEALLLGHHSEGSASSVQKPYDPDVAWAEALEVAQCKAASLYQDYRFPFRFFAMIDLIFKILLILVNVVIAPFTNFAAACNVALYAIMFITLLAVRPYVNRPNQLLAVLAAFCEMFVSAYTIALWKAPSSVDSLWVEILVVVIGGVLPVGVAIAFVIKQFPERMALWRKQRQLQKKREDTMEKKLDDLKRAKKVEFENTHFNDPNVNLEALPAKWKKIEDDIVEEFKKDYPQPHEVVVVDNINSQTKATVLRFFAFVSVPLLLVALVLTIFAATHSQQLEFADASTYLDRSPGTVLNGYNTWNEFSEACCCFMPLSPQPGFNTTERWACRGPQSNAVNWTSGRTIQRSRITSDVRNDGLPIRPLCGSTMTPECTVSIVDNVTVQLNCPSDWLQVNNVTYLAQLTLW